MLHDKQLLKHNMIKTCKPTFTIFACEIIEYSTCSFINHVMESDTSGTFSIHIKCHLKIVPLCEVICIDMGIDYLLLVINNDQIEFIDITR